MLGKLILAPRSYRDSPRQVGWIFGVTLPTSLVTAPWYLGILALQGRDALNEDLGWEVPGYPPHCTDDRLPHRPKPPHRAKPPVEYGPYHALVIGIDQYQEFPRLETAVNDATAVAALLRDDYGFTVDSLFDADRGAILRSLRGLRERLGRKANLLIYYAGHGSIDRATNQGYWLPSTAAPGDPTEWISNSDITTELKGISAKHILVVADSCFSGSLTRQAWFSDSPGDNVMSLVRRRARLVMTSGGLEPVTDSGEGKYSVFARFFLHALENNAGLLEGSELFSTVRHGVTSYSRQVPEYGPIQLMGHDGGDFLFVRED